MTTFTFRLGVELREKFHRKARLLGKSESEFLREILNRELEDRSTAAPIGHLKGTLSLRNQKQGGWRQTIKDRHWRS